MIKITNDLRLLASGPLAAIHEISLPEVQPGSSIMPGKVNPSIPEALTMICAQVLGNTETINVLTRMAQLQLQQFTPGIARALIDSIEQLTLGIALFRNSCVKGIKPNKKRIKELLDGSLAHATDYSEEL
ncbi:MAG: hypothetical protein H6765_04255 [Candidatus Peribacteria bacterium]|nr:MAG: hypothetical protein H6765_04255 [Candidatus Peribacteria bacterium]